MAIKFNRSQTFATNGTVDAPSLHNLVDGLDIYQSLITDQTNVTSVSTADELLIAIDAGSEGDAPKAVTVQELFQDALTAGTYTNANISEALTYGTATGTRLVSDNATITTGTITTAVIPSLTAGTTTSTAATITSGTVTNLASTTGTIATLNSTTGTIGNLSTTLAGDFTISSGTGTLGTTGVTAGTYGSASAIPFLTVDAKGRITSATSGTFSSTPPANSVTFNTLSTSATEADNVASRTAKAWVNFDGTNAFSPNPSTTAIRASFNVSSITDIATGRYTINFTTAMLDANYSVTASASPNAANAALAVQIFAGTPWSTSAPTTSSFSIVTPVSTTTPTDLEYVCLSVFR